jgi:hypothetical protein
MLSLPILDQRHPSSAEGANDRAPIDPHASTAASPAPPAHVPGKGQGGASFRGVALDEAVGEGALSARERAIALALAEAAIPQGNILDGASPATIERLDRLLGAMPAAQRAGMKALLWACEAAPLPTHRRPLSALAPAERERFLEGWASADSFHARTLLRAVLTPVKLAHFDDEALFRKVACAHRAPAVAVEEAPRWLRQVTDGRQVDEDLSLECEVVVVGTGAGGAAAAYELARRGRAVLLLEDGDYHRRGAFNGRATEAFNHFYRDRGVTVALGNTGSPLPTGRMVGGSTAINSGTCYRTPERTFRYWREKHGLPGDFSSAGLSPYYDRVEAMLQVTRADRRFLGGIARVVARGADAMGLEHGPLMRNAPDCDGQGMCAFGCPTGAKRSTDVSYVPAALTLGAQLITGAHVERVDIVAGAARGVRARLASGRALRVKADAVVVAGGALMTPLLLERSGACGQSGWLGRNLSIHPCSKVMAMFDEVIDMSSAIPQGYAIESFADEGLMFEGGSVPLDVTSMGIPWTGRKLMDLLDSYRNLALFGLMIQDTSRGRVRKGPGGSPLITYDLGRRDIELLHRGITLLSEIFLRAGARRVFPFVPGHEEITDRRGLEALRHAPARAGDVEVSAYHPLGTCRAGTDPRRSCIGPDQEAHDVRRLYVCDGSAMPSSLGVNPQLTIMAMSLRAAEIIDSRLS